MEKVKPEKSQKTCLPVPGSFEDGAFLHALILTQPWMGVGCVWCRGQRTTLQSQLLSSTAGSGD